MTGPGDAPHFDAQKNLVELAGRRLVFHCHHYNLFLQRIIEDALPEEGPRIQMLAAAEAVRIILSELFGASPEAELQDKLARARALFGSLGFGLAQPEELGAMGGRVQLATSHYAIGWRSKFGPSQRPVCHFAVGYWVAALTAACNLPPERMHGRELQCAATGAPSCILAVEVQ